MLLRRNLELIKNVSPELLHVVPISDHAVLNWIVQLQDTLELFSSVADERVLLVLRDHDLLVDGSSNTI